MESNFFLVYPIFVVLTSNPTLGQVLFALSGATVFAGVLENLADADRDIA